MKHRVLIDLKPAFDGFAGIPQETRLLFKGLRNVEGLDVEGLIQHGGRRIRAGLRRHLDYSNQSERVNQLSKFIVSLSDQPRQTALENLENYIAKTWGLQFLKAQVSFGRTIRSTDFDGTLFPDFVWRTFFDKTLNVEDMPLTTKGIFKIIQNPRVHFQRAGLTNATARAIPQFPKIDTRDFDYFVAQTPFPGRVSTNTKLIVRYHDAVPILMPHTISDQAFHQASHYQSLRRNIYDSAHLSCISESTRSDLLNIFPEAEDQVSVIHNMISDEYFESHPSEPKPNLQPLIRNRQAETDRKHALPVPGFSYILMVSTIEPRKNHIHLLAAWEQLKYFRYPDLKLIIVGGLGWGHTRTLSAFKPWIEQGELIHLQNVLPSELRTLYQQADATVCPSLAEGFDYSGIEAMCCGCPVASSDIPVHREIYDSASSYFNPYSVADTAECLHDLLDKTGATGELRNRQITNGRNIREKYRTSRILPKWEDLFTRLSVSGH